MRATGQGGIRHGWRRGPSGPLVRLAAAVVLLVLAALGSVARGVTHLSAVGMLAGPVRPVTVIAGVAAAAGCLVLAGVLVMQASRERRKEVSGIPEPAPWWARALSVLAVLALFALAIAVVLVTFTGRHRGRQPEVAPIPVVPALGHAPGAGHSSGTAGTAVLLLAVVLVALLVNVIAVVVLWLRRRAAAAPLGPAGASSPLAAAVEAGRSALGTTAGVREAIIACYAAMEDTLAAAGSARRAADTPEELLDRAMRNGVIRTPAAQRLTALFREARFSPHELAEAQQQAARTSLADIGHDLSGAP
jgi:hypothetical protein